MSFYEADKIIDIRSKDKGLDVKDLRSHVGVVADVIIPGTPDIQHFTTRSIFNRVAAAAGIALVLSSCGPTLERINEILPGGRQAVQPTPGPVNPETISKRVTETPTSTLTVTPTTTTRQIIATAEPTATNTSLPASTREPSIPTSTQVPIYTVTPLITQVPNMHLACIRNTEGFYPEDGVKIKSPVNPEEDIWSNVRLQQGTLVHVLRSYTNATYDVVQLYLSENIGPNGDPYYYVRFTNDTPLKLDDNPVIKGTVETSQLQPVLSANLCH